MTMTDTRGGLLDHLNAEAAGGDDLDALPATPARTLPGQFYDVTCEDGTGFRVRVTNRDRVAWDMTAAKRRWPAFGDAPFLATTFVVWNAAKREQHTTLGFEAFSDAAAAIDPVMDEEGQAGTDPTRKAPPPTSS